MHSRHGTDSCGRFGAQTGGALPVALLLLAALIPLSAALVSVVQGRSEAALSARQLDRAQWAAETGIALRVLALNDGDFSDAPFEYPLPDGASATATFADIDGRLATITSTGVDREVSVTLFALIEQKASPLARRALTVRSDLDLKRMFRVSGFDSSRGLPGPANSGSTEVYSADEVDVSGTVIGDVLSADEIEIESGGRVLGRAVAPEIEVDGQLTGGRHLQTPPEETFGSHDAEVASRLASARSVGVGMGDVRVGLAQSRVFGPGVYSFEKLEVGASGRVSFHGPATIVASEISLGLLAEMRVTGDVTFILGSGGLTMKLGSQIHFPERAADGYADAHVEIYADGPLKFEELARNSAGAPPRPADFQIFMAGGHDVSFGLLNTFFAFVSSPEGKVDFGGSGSLYGAVVADSFSANNSSLNHFELQFDHALGGGAGGDYEVNVVTTMTDNAR